MATTAPGKLQPIIVKRVRKGSHAPHHSNAWKIAYADFVTAMMAFFLLMWLLGSTTQGDLQGIASYFQSPLKVALSGGSGSGDGNSVLPGGGAILPRASSDIKRGEVELNTRNLKVLRAEVERADANRQRQLQQELELAMEQNPLLRPLRQQIRMDITADGLRIQIVDSQRRPMFASGSAQVQEHMRELLRSIGLLIEGAGGDVVLSGHTDASPYSGGERGYSNWELSSDRANASRRELLAGGLKEGRVMRVLGMGSSVPFEPADPLSPLNRRISILVLGELGKERWRTGTEVPVSESEALERILERRGREEGAAPQAQPAATTPNN